MKARILGFKHAAEVIKSGRAIPYNLEDCFRESNGDKAREIADPGKIERAYTDVLASAKRAIQEEERKNWYFWAKPRGRRTSPDLGAENVFKAFYKDEPLKEEEKKVVLGSLAIIIEEELNELKKERDAIKK